MALIYHVVFPTNSFLKSTTRRETVDAPRSSPQFPRNNLGSLSEEHSVEIDLCRHIALPDRAEIIANPALSENMLDLAIIFSIFMVNDSHEFDDRALSRLKAWRNRDSGEIYKGRYCPLILTYKHLYPYLLALVSVSYEDEIFQHCLLGRNTLIRSACCPPFQQKSQCGNWFASRNHLWKYPRLH